MNREDKISIVIIAKNEPRIRYTLQALTLQILKPYEVIIIVDYPDDISAKIALKYIGRLPLKVVVNDIKPGYGGARRKGVEVSNGDIIAFLDADTIPPPTWTERIIMNIKRNPVVSGPSIWINEDDVEDIISSFHMIANQQNYLHIYCGGENAITWVSFAPTQNFAFKRDVIELIGNFDENFDIGGEDYDFCLRLRKAGIRILEDRSMYVYHLKHKGLVKKSWRNGRARAKVFMKHRLNTIRDAGICFLHGCAVLSLLAIILFIVVGNLHFAYPFVALLILSLSHRLYRALVTLSRGASLGSALVESIMTYVSYIGFVIEVTRLLATYIVAKLFRRLQMA